MTVQILRLRDGFDIVSQIEYINDGLGIQLTYPMLFQLRNTNLMLQHWLPLSIIEGNSVVISSDEVVCIMEPNSSFKDYYQSTISKIDEVMNKDKEEMDELALVLEEFENTEGLPIH